MKPKKLDKAKTYKAPKNGKNFTALESLPDSR